MHPPDCDCPAWEYADHPKRQIILQERTEDIIVQLYQQQLDFVEHAADTRPIHRYLFCLLVPREQIYYAGHYRGEDFPCLKNYYAGIEGDSQVGFPPFLVEERMEKIAQWIQECMKVLQDLRNCHTRSLTLFKQGAWRKMLQVQVVRGVTGVVERQVEERIISI